MKKVLFMFIIIFSISFGVEIIPEDFVMEKVLMPLSSAPTYVSQNSDKELKAIQVTTETLKNLKTNENPFYIYDSAGIRQLVRIGDYFISSPKLSDIYIMQKNEFENNFYNKDGRNIQSIDTIEDNDIKINPIDVDESYEDYQE